MKHVATLLRIVLIGGPLLLLDAAAPQPVKAQSGSTLRDSAVPCQAVARNSVGGWTVVSPVKLAFGEVSMEFVPGDVFGPGSMTHGVALPVILDRQCGS